jgi:hypothetical protein
MQKLDSDLELWGPIGQKGFLRMANNTSAFAGKLPQMHASLVLILTLPCCWHQSFEYLNVLLTVISEALSAGLGGAFSSAALYPIEICKNRLQASQVFSDSARFDCSAATGTDFVPMPWWKKLACQNSHTRFRTLRCQKSKPSDKKDGAAAKGAESEARLVLE